MTFIDAVGILVFIFIAGVTCLYLLSEIDDASFFNKIKKVTVTEGKNGTKVKLVVSLKYKVKKLLRKIFNMLA